MLQVVKELTLRIRLSGDDHKPGVMALDTRGGCHVELLNACDEQHEVNETPCQNKDTICPTVLQVPYHTRRAYIAFHQDFVVKYVLFPLLPSPGAFVCSIERACSR
jgi:hypothetical protein